MADHTPSRRILFVADSAEGGAGVAASRLYHSMKDSGLEVRFLVFRNGGEKLTEWGVPSTDGTSGWHRKVLKAIGLMRVALVHLHRWWRSGRRDRFFHGAPDTFEITTVYLGSKHLDNHPLFRWADVIHLHWTAGFLSPQQRWKDKLWVISLHDAYPLTAVCHFPGDCRQYETGCQVCPQLAMTRNPRVVSEIYARKLKGFGTGGRITFHAPSRWIAQMAAASRLTASFSSVILPNVFPTEVFRPIGPQASRQVLGLPEQKRLGLFVAASLGNVRKGFGWFVKLAESLEPQGWEFFIVGGGVLPELPKNCRSLGRLNDLRLMAAAYSAADIFVSTTLQDTVPATIVEAQLCGTPVIGFDVGGQSEMLVAGETGYLDARIELEGLLRGVSWFESRNPSRERIAALAENRWSSSKVVSDWTRFYQELA